MASKRSHPSAGLIVLKRAICGAAAKKRAHGGGSVGGKGFYKKDKQKQRGWVQPCGRITIHTKTGRLEQTHWFLSSSSPSSRSSSRQPSTSVTSSTSSWSSLCNGCCFDNLVATIWSGSILFGSTSPESHLFDLSVLWFEHSALSSPWSLGGKL